MSVPSEIQSLTKGVVASFESGIDAVSHLIGKGLEILDGYRAEQDAIRGSLREAFASVGSLRRKDFDGVVERILTFQLQRESEIKRLIREFLGCQKELTRRLRRSLEAGILEEAKRCKAKLGEIIEKAREEISAFQGEQETIRKTFEGLEARKAEITAREFKKVIQDLETELLGTDDTQQQAMGNG